MKSYTKNNKLYYNSALNKYLFTAIMTSIVHIIFIAKFVKRNMSISIY